MKKLILTLMVSFLISPLSVFADNTLLNQKIENVIKKFGDINIGVLVQDAKSGEVIYKQNADRYFMPASNEKLFTGFAALQFLGFDFTYLTQLFADTSKIQNGILNDNVYLKFSGDPTLTLSQLDQLIQSLSKAGVKTINGKLIIDDSAFDQTSKSPGSSWDDKDFCWGSPISALTIDQNCVSALVKPASTPNQPAILVLPEHPQSMQFINQVITAPANKAGCFVNINRSTDTSYTITGCIKVKANPAGFEMAIDSPRDNATVLLKHLLNKNKIFLTKNIEFNKTETSLNPLFQISSARLEKLVTTMMKESDNGIADSLFKTIGAQYSRTSGSFENGSDALRGILAKKLRLQLPKATLVDGSGASRYNLVTPKQIATFLKNIIASPLASNFIASLPISGIDGTLKYRLGNPGFLQKVRAKTGTETSITALSGYLETRSKRQLIFSIMINNFIEQPRKYKALENKICKVIIENS